MSEQERETEEDEGEGTSDTAPMLPGRLADRQTSARMSPGWAAQGLGTLLLSGRALAGLLLHLLLPATVFLLVLLPAATIVYLGFLCHSRAEGGERTKRGATHEKVVPAGNTPGKGLEVHPAPRPACRALLSDRGSAALIVLGFLSLPPLLVLASAARARLARRLRALLPPPTRGPGPRGHSVSSDWGCTRSHPDGEEQLCAWV